MSSKVCADMNPKAHGHYCKICGQCKSNESFSGKGHATHICKVCARLPPEQRSLQIALNRLDSFAFRYLSKSDIEWLKKRTHDQRPEVRELAEAIYQKRFCRKVEKVSE